MDKGGILNADENVESRDRQPFEYHGIGKEARRVLGAAAHSNRRRGNAPLYNVLGKEVLKKKGRFPNDAEDFFFFQLCSPILPTNDNYYEMERIADFGRKRTLCISAEYAPDGLVGGRGLCGGLM